MEYVCFDCAITEFPILSKDDSEIFTLDISKKSVWQNTQTSFFFPKREHRPAFASKISSGVEVLSILRLKGSESEAYDITYV